MAENQYTLFDAMKAGGVINLGIGAPGPDALKKVSERFAKAVEHNMVNF